MRTGFAASLAALLGVGCSGDVRPLEEAVEVRELGLDSLSIRPPVGSIVDPVLVVSAGERVPFTLRGIDGTGTEIDIEGTARSWRVSDPNVAAIDEDGLFVARADGDTDIDVRIGDVVAGTFEVRVSTAPITSIERIVRTGRVDEAAPDDEEPGPLDPCVAERFIAIGRFADDSERLLPSVEWRSETSGARLARTEQDDGSILLSASVPGTVALSAAFNQASSTVDVPIGATLQSLSVSPTGNIQRGSARDLVATGRFGETTDEETDEATRDVVVTDTVDWDIVGGTDFLDVSNDDGSRGRISANSVGTATVRASCGDEAGTLQLSVFDNRDTGGVDDGVRFDGAENGRLELASTRAPVFLRLLDGDEDVTDEAFWSLDESDDLAATLFVESPSRVVLTPLSVGQVRVEADYDSRTYILRVVIF